MGRPSLRQHFDTGPSGLPIVVVLQHHARDPLGAMEAPLCQAATLVRVRGYEDIQGATALVESLIETGDYHGVLALGGPMGVYEADSSPLLRLSLRMIGDALARDIPILGLCLGSQMLAEVLGSPVYPGAERGLPFEVGFHPLMLTAAGQADPIGRLFSGDWPVLMWHKDTHDLPEGSTLLASSEVYAMQAFRVSRHVYGLQFHPEADLRVLRVWLREVVPTGMLSADFGAELLAQSTLLDSVVRHRAEQLALAFLSWVSECHAARQTTGARPHHSESSRPIYPREREKST